MKTSVEAHNFRRGNTGEEFTSLGARAKQQHILWQRQLQKLKEFSVKMSGTVETELRKLEKIVPGLLKTDEKMEMVGLKF